MKTYAHLCQFCSDLLRMRNVSDKSCRENQNTHFMFNNCGNIWWRQTGHRWQYGARTSRAGYLRLQTHTEDM